jgi:hypothetical protein
VAVIIPPGVAPGSSFLVNVPAGQMVQMVAAPHGAAQGGHYEYEKYCGCITILIALFLFPCVCCCPCDERQVYVAPNGSRHAM